MYCRSLCRLTHACVAAVVLAVLCTSEAAAALATFTGLGDLPGGKFESYATDVSGDGSVVVGYCGDQAFRWTQTEEMAPLLGPIQSRATAITDDGTRVVGSGVYYGEETAETWISLVMWMEQSAATELYQISELASTIATPLDISADGIVIVGYEYTFGGPGHNAVLWSAGQRTELGSQLIQGQRGVATYASAVSADGSTVLVNTTHSSDDFDFEPRAYLWTEATGMVDLGLVFGTTGWSEAVDITPDGKVIVGRTGAGAFRWAEDRGIVDLGNLLGGSAQPRAVSPDGDTIIGSSTRYVFIETEYRWMIVHEAFVWTLGGGTENLQEKLVANGATCLDGWQLTEATAISADGRTIVGNGINPFGQNEAWIATLPIPEPSGFLLAALLAGVLSARRTR